MLSSSITRIVTFAILCCGLSPSQAQAGPLIDWLFGGRSRNQPAYPVGPPVPLGNAYGVSSGNAAAPAGSSTSGYVANYGTYYGSGLPVIGPAGAGYPAPLPSGITAATMPGANAYPSRTFSYVPNYGSYANRAPVTYYRPILTTDPNTGAQVVALAPCTSYEYQTQRVPLFGRRALFGSSAPPAVPPPPAAMPSYTLPSGGIPLAYAAPSVAQPSVLGYGSYSSLQPPAGSMAPYQAAPGSYPPAPAGPSPYYGSASGGSCGNCYNPSTPVPGLYAPPASGSGLPPGYQSAPSTTSPNFPLNPGASGNAPSSDPAADAQPTLPPTFPSGSSAQSNLRPQLRSIVRQPLANEPEEFDRSQTQESRDAPTMMTPIPVPQGFEHQPRWNPGLLNPDDLTAMRPLTPEQAVVAGQSKPIQWASFEQASRSASKPAPVTVKSKLRPIQPSYLGSAPSSALAPIQLERTSHTQYDNTGWKASR